jgi:hypothetical protein
MGIRWSSWTGLCRSTGMCCIRKARGEIHNREHVAVFELRDDQRFRRRVSGIFLSTFDGFIVTHNPSFVLLYESFNKPIIVVNTCRYEQPYRREQRPAGWKTLNGKLKELYDSGRITVVSNNRADQDYLEMGTGIKSTYIPSCVSTRTPSIAPVG